MAILACETCGNTQSFYEVYHPIERDAHNRIIRENGWVFDPATRRCIADMSDTSGQNQPYARQCLVCSQRTVWVYSSEPPPPPANYTPRRNAMILSSNNRSPFMSGLSGRVGRPANAEAANAKADCAVVAEQVKPALSYVDVVEEVATGFA
ncbi:hypothetical protein V5O48_013182 [Marasmius crinis-equi]|uniref:Uncharacterized protein n=1 Tax=Marasmius crinis-equi TaxID=585013 RepID=A0ABR3F0S6_9AGAR